VTEESAKYYLSIRNWEKYQHYKKGTRNLLWVKLYTNLLYDPDFQSLADPDKWFFIQALLLAPSVENRFPLLAKWWSKWSRNSRVKIVTQLRNTRLWSTFMLRNDGTVVEIIEDVTILASNLLEQSRVDKSRVYKPPIPPLRDASVKAHRVKLDHDPNFAIFWSKYPRHENKQAALKAWSKLNGDREAILALIVPWIEQAKISDQWQDLKFIPHPSTFLNQRRWEGNTPPKQSQSSGYRTLGEQKELQEWLDTIKEPDNVL